MKIALTLLLLALLGISNAANAPVRNIPLAEEVIRGVTEEVIHADTTFPDMAPTRARRKTRQADTPTPPARRVEEVVRQGGRSEEIIYGDVTIPVPSGSRGRGGGTAQEADVSVKGLPHLAPGLLPEGHEQASHSGVPKNETVRSKHFAHPGLQDRVVRHRKLLDKRNAQRNLQEEVRMMVCFKNMEGKALVDEYASIVYEYITEVKVVAVLLTWAQVQTLLENENIL
jgi:hypothetical protein